jgi:ribosome-binding protein aMBF1 (putative translation factor)
MDHQDWVVKTVKSKNNQGGGKSNQSKQYAKSKEQKMNISEEEGKLSHKKMDSDFGKTLQKYRLSQGLTQKDIAQKLNIPVKDINEIESGKMKHNGQLMGKIKRLINK